jgi:hypothetical protein
MWYDDVSTKFCELSSSRSSSCVGTDIHGHGTINLIPLKYYDKWTEDGRLKIQIVVSLPWCAWNAVCEPQHYAVNSDSNGCMY